MNPFKLDGITPSGKKGTAWACGECMKAAHDEAMATRCCTCAYCGEPLGTEVKTTSREGSFHSSCQREAWAKQDADRMAKAEKLESWDGGVFWGDDYYASLDDAIEAMDCEDDELPEYIYVAKPVGPPRLDGGNILQNLAENYCFNCEDYEIELAGGKEFADACEAFNEANKNIQLFKEDTKRAVKVPRPGV